MHLIELDVVPPLQDRIARLQPEERRHFHRRPERNEPPFLPDVVRQGDGYLAVTPCFGHRLFPPRAEMHFVHAHRRSKRIAPSPLLQPALIGPRKLPIVPCDRGVFRRRLKKETIRIGFEDHRPAGIPQFIFVEGALAHSRHE